SRPGPSERGRATRPSPSPARRRLTPRSDPDRSLARRCRSAGRELREPVADVGGTQWLSGYPPGQLGRDRLGYSAGLLGVAEVVQQEGDREYGRYRIGDALPGDIRRGAVYRLEHRRVPPLRVDAAARGQPDAASDRGGDVGE